MEAYRTLVRLELSHTMSTRIGLWWRSGNDCGRRREGGELMWKVLARMAYFEGHELGVRLLCPRIHLHPSPGPDHQKLHTLVLNYRRNTE